MAIEKDIDALAKHIADLAMSSEPKVPFNEKVDALKTLVGLYAIRLKGKVKSEDALPGFADWTKQLENGNGETTVGRHQQRRRRAIPREAAGDE